MKHLKQPWNEVGLLLVFIIICQLSMANSKMIGEKDWAKPVKQEVNLYQIDEKLFRSQQLEEKEYELLRELQVKTIISLRFFDRDEDEESFAGKGLELVNIPLKTWNIKAEEVAKVLWEIEKYQKEGAVLVHCYHGADRTGIVSAMYRVIYQNWTLEEAKRELIEGPYGFHSIWKNIQNFFTEENEKIIRTELERWRTLKEEH